MKIGVYGSAAGPISPEIVQKAHEIGREIARQGYIIITGACAGLPQEAVLGAQEIGGEVIGYSPATNLEEHIKAYKMPTEGITSFVFVPQDYKHIGNHAICKKYRNVSSVADTDAVIIISGRIGTMNEFTNAFDFGKNIGILEGSGGITNRAIKILLEDTDKQSNSAIIYDSDPVSLVRRLVKLHKAP